MSAFGTKRTFGDAQPMLGVKQTCPNVRYSSESRHRRLSFRMSVRDPQLTSADRSPDHHRSAVALYVTFCGLVLSSNTVISGGFPDSPSSFQRATTRS